MLAQSPAQARPAVGDGAAENKAIAPVGPDSREFRARSQDEFGCAASPARHLLPAARDSRVGGSAPSWARFGPTFVRPPCVRADDSRRPPAAARPVPLARR